MACDAFSCMSAVVDAGHTTTWATVLEDRTDQFMLTAESEGPFGTALIFGRAVGACAADDVGFAVCHIYDLARRAGCREAAGAFGAEGQSDAVVD